MVMVIYQYSDDDSDVDIDGDGDGSGDGSLLVTDTRDMLLRQEEVENQISSQNNVLPSCFLYRLPWSEINY